MNNDKKVSDGTSTERSESHLDDEVFIEVEVENDAKEVIDNEKPESIQNQGRLLLDATVTEQAIRFPTDLG